MQGGREVERAVGGGSVGRAGVVGALGWVRGSGGSVRMALRLHQLLLGRGNGGEVSGSR